MTKRFSRYGEPRLVAGVQDFGSWSDPAHGCGFDSQSDGESDAGNHLVGYESHFGQRRIFVGW